jgi:hypothetical protein
MTGLSLALLLSFHSPIFLDYVHDILAGDACVFSHRPTLLACRGHLCSYVVIRHLYRTRRPRLGAKVQKVSYL